MPQIKPLARKTSGTARITIACPSCDNEITTPIRSTGMCNRSKKALKNELKAPVPGFRMAVAARK
jgi:hypothetical protein